LSTAELLLERQLTVLSREGCELCEHLLADLADLAATLPLPPITVQDVDDDAQLARRYGLDIPVLLLDGVKVCQHRLDAAELRRLLRHR
jgi:Glutaredoxin-like domain (DUF836)